MGYTPEMLDLIKKTDDFQELKRNAATAEVPIAGWTADGTYIPGRLDALSLAGMRATALDFKTGEVNRSQMELYRLVLAEIFPHGRLAAVQPAEKSKESGKTYEEEW